MSYVVNGDVATMSATIFACSHKFDNGVVVVNTTPHPITMVNTDGTPVGIPSSVPAGERSGKLLINARAEETPCGKHTVRTRFVGDDSAVAIIRAIQACFPEEHANGDLMIVGSIIAANTYTEVVGLVPAPGYERVPPAEKRMSCEKFNQGDAE